MSNWRRFTPLVLGLLVLAAVPLTAQTNTYTITGRVLDESSSAPLVGVQVLVSGTRYGGLTNSQGRYSVVAQLSAGTYTVEAQMIGRETVTREITAGTERVINVPDITMRSG